MNIEYYETVDYFAENKQIDIDSDMILGHGFVLTNRVYNSYFKIDFKKVLGYIYFDLEIMRIFLKKQDKKYEELIVIFIRDNLEVFEYYASHNL